jgi:hypothetical protein
MAVCGELFQSWLAAVSPPTFTVMPGQPPWWRPWPVPPAPA